MSTEKLFVFDLDGTIVNTLEDISDSMNAVLKRFGWQEKPQEHYRKLVGGGTLNMVMKTISEHTEQHSHIHRLFELHYKRHYLIKTNAYNGIAEVLKIISDSPHSLAVLSNKSHSLVIDITSKLFGEINFDMIIGLSSNIPAKPNPYSLLKMIESSNAKQSFMIGDTVIDMETARLAGANAIAVLWGYSEKSKLLAIKPDKHFQEVSELLKWVNKEVSLPHMIHKD